MHQPLLLARRDSPLQWHEAAAVVRAVADAVADGRLRSVPPARTLALDSTGAVRTGAPGEAGPPARSGPELAGDLRRLLAELLDSDAPAALRSLAGVGDTNVPAGDLAAFRDALAFFERPSKERDLRALAGRLHEAQEKSDLESELARLTEKARLEGGGAPTEPRTLAPTPKDKPRWNTRLVVAVVILVATGAMGFVVAGLPGRNEPSGPARVSDDRPKGFVAALRAAAASTFGTAAPFPPAAAPPVKAPPGAAGRAPRPPRAHVRAETARQPQRAVEIYHAGQPEVIEVFASDPPDPEPARRLPRESVTIYDRRDPDVIPATLLRPHLPTLPRGAPAGHVGLLDVLVGEDGRVESVRLVATTSERRYYDAMILAAVKAWIFRPASRGGHPVRYRVHVPLT